MSEYNECPLGVNMHDFEHADRIQELSKAISRYACFSRGLQSRVLRNDSQMGGRNKATVRNGNKITVKGER